MTGASVSSTAPLIELRGITRHFTLGEQTVQAVAGIDLAIRHGEYCSLMGPSGSGKSTLLNLIALLDRPNSGEYRLDGSDVTTLSDDDLAGVRSRTIGFVFQFFHLVPRLTAAQNVELPLILAGVTPRDRAARVAQALSALGIAERAHHRPAELSGGQRQRVAIARAMIMRPALILADEPTGNLDEDTARQVMALLCEMIRETGSTLVMATHSSEPRALADRVLRLQQGQLQEEP